MVLRDAVAGLLLFGALVGRTDLQESGGAALRELAARGYQVASAEQPVRVYALERGAAEPAHAAGWRAGVISLRADPAGTHRAAVYLRHELMHEANFRTCGGRLAPWADEAAALAFSGEAREAGDVEPQAVARLRRAVRLDSPLDPISYRALNALVAQHGWPSEPCATSTAISNLLAPERPAAALSYVVISAYSGRVLESQGGVDARWPPGSLLKLPYVAALEAGDPNELGRALARSDSDDLLGRRAGIDRGRLRSILPKVAPNEIPSLQGAEADWRPWIGERDASGNYPIEASLAELALMVRAALLLEPARFVELQRNGELDGSTLARADAAARREMKLLQALAKTGTVSNDRGEPLVGMIALAWPAHRPAYIAVLRQGGVRGSAVLDGVADHLARWRQVYRPERSEVRVKLFSLLRPSDVTVQAACPELSVDRDDQSFRTTTCGELRFHTEVPGARRDRVVRGLVRLDDSGWLLRTDPETYADSVLESEAADLRGEAEIALRAVVVWNATHGFDRHRQDRALCDTTHCMVYRGEPITGVARRGAADPEALALLDQLARDRGIEWFPFSKGGGSEWSRDFQEAELARFVGEAAVLDISRERTRQGEVRFHLSYPSGAEVVSCDVLRQALSLPSCPSAITRVGAAWRLAGKGEGHGVGLDVEGARAASASGRKAVQILKDAYAPSVSSDSR